MRYDDIGMFWEDLPAQKRGGKRVEGPMPEIPETGWRAPTEFPNLSAARAIGIDTETYDPELTEKGPGWGRGSGHMVGFSIAVPDGPSWYFPMRHEARPEENLCPETCLRWAQSVLGDARPKIGANIIYDLGWFRQEGVEVAGPYYDIQHAEPLLRSEAPHVSLDALARRYLGLGKTTNLLYEWLGKWFTWVKGDRLRKYIHRAPASLVGPYAESDAALPLLIMNKQWRELGSRGLLDLFNLESRLTPLLRDMRWHGVPIDVEYAERLEAELSGRLVELEADLGSYATGAINFGSAQDLAKVFTALGIHYPTTAKGNPSFTAGFLETVGHPFVDKLLDYRRIQKNLTTFVRGYLLDAHVNGSIHAEFHPLKGDENGARSGRFASSNPNLQNLPTRTEEGRRIREAFIASGLWRKYDYSQIEYRLLAHHAVGAGSDEIRRLYVSDPATDYHAATAALVLALTGIELERAATKTINFGLIYGMGRGELIHRLRLSAAKGNQLYRAYHKAVPFAKATADACSSEAAATGRITTVLGRESHFDSWGPARFDPDAPALPFAEALQEYGQVARAFTHKALNRKLQGGNADIIKSAMVAAYEGGIFAATGLPLLTVHDELDFDDPMTPASAEGFAALHHLMEHVVTLTVPIRVELSTGKNWGVVK